jgi:hypothetical protein
MGIDGDVVGRAELAVARAGAAPAGDEATRGVEDLDLVVARVGDVDAVQRVDGDPGG